MAKVSLLSTKIDLTNWHGNIYNNLNTEKGLFCLTQMIFFLLFAKWILCHQLSFINWMELQSFNYGYWPTIFTVCVKTAPNKLALEWTDTDQQKTLAWSFGQKRQQRSGVLWGLHSNNSEGLKLILCFFYRVPLPWGKPRLCDKLFLLTQFTPQLALAVLNN